MIDFRPLCCSNVQFSTCLWVLQCLRGIFFHFLGPWLLNTRWAAWKPKRENLKVIFELIEDEMKNRCLLYYGRLVCSNSCFNSISLKNKNVFILSRRPRVSFTLAASKKERIPKFQAKQRLFSFHWKKYPLFYVFIIIINSPVIATTSERLIHPGYSYTDNNFLFHFHTDSSYFYLNVSFFLPWYFIPSLYD